ncbi:MAG: hypothetical protein N3D12_01700 [Candidatus Methanomethyliaceae archaeon]|nr:hypothetical protein [Candidatus Methanomethyliaceae archaeon]
MEQVISRILIAVAVVGLISYAATYAPLIINRDIGAETIREKAAELGSYLMDKDPKIVYGFSTGSKAMTTIRVGENNITLFLAGDIIQWQVPKNALLIRGAQFASPPSSEISTSTSEPLLFYSTSDGFYIQPKVVVIPPTTSLDLSNTPVHFLSIRTCYLSTIKTSGHFDLIKEITEADRHVYERAFLYDGTIRVYVNGVNCISFEVKRGEKLLVEFLHYNVRLIPMPRG